MSSIKDALIAMDRTAPEWRVGEAGEPQRSERAEPAETAGSEAAPQDMASKGLADPIALVDEGIALRKAYRREGGDGPQPPYDPAPMAKARGGYGFRMCLDCRTVVDTQEAHACGVIVVQGRALSNEEKETLRNAPMMPIQIPDDESTPTPNEIGYRMDCLEYDRDEAEARAELAESVLFGLGWDHVREAFAYGAPSPCEAGKCVFCDAARSP